MLRLYDPATDALHELHPGPVRIQVHGSDPRVHVVADVLRRVAHRRGHQVLIGRSGPSGRDLAALNVQPMEWDPDEADLHVSDVAQSGRTVMVAPSGELPPHADPPSQRLALLATHYRSPVDAAPSGDLLARWRNLVAAWADAPGKPMSAEYVAEAGAALDNDLDVPGALSVMDRLAADPEPPPGAKFETFVHLDLILALDLVSAIGRPR
ncbi:MAG TPA: hypothetical protein VH912_24405 [Streptosporangiaceae bacterium]|jgi:hypothetical protein